MFSTQDESGLFRVLSFLKSHNSEYLSGQDLSDVLKISRVAIWKHIKKIRELGYTIKSKQKLGYMLEADTDKLLPWEVTDGLDTKTIGRHVYYFDYIDSTQNRAASIMAKGAPDGTTIIADKQYNGKGRDGRKWISPEGGIWLSVILLPKFDISVVTLFPLAASLALSIAIKKTLGIQTELKWPNDLTLNGKKVAGMLVDTSLELNRVENLILGVGINFNINTKNIQKMLKDVPNFYGITSLTKTKKIKPKILVQAFLSELECIYNDMNDGNTERIIREWTEMSSTIGRDIEVNTTSGKIIGNAIKIDDGGALIISDGVTSKKITAGDVIHV